MNFYMYTPIKQPPRSRYKAVPGPQEARLYSCQSLSYPLLQRFFKKFSELYHPKTIGTIFELHINAIIQHVHLHVRILRLNTVSMRFLHVCAHTSSWLLCSIVVCCVDILAFIYPFHRSKMFGSSVWLLWLTLLCTMCWVYPQERNCQTKGSG